MLNPFENEERKAFRETVRRFVEQDIRPYVDEWDEAGTLPDELWGHLLERTPVGVRAELDGDRVVSSRLVDPDGQPVTFDDGSVTTRWRPTPTLVVMGPGPVADAVARAGAAAGCHEAESEDYYEQHLERFGGVSSHMSGLPAGRRP